MRGNISAAKEVRCNGRDRPADILLVPWEKGQDYAVDFVVSHPLGLAEHCFSSNGLRSTARGRKHEK